MRCDEAPRLEPSAQAQSVEGIVARHPHNVRINLLFYLKFNLKLSRCCKVAYTFIIYSFKCDAMKRLV